MSIAIHCQSQMDIQSYTDKRNILIQVLPKVIWKERVATPHGRDWTCPLPSCATSCAIPTADEFNHSATGTLHRNGNATYVTLRYLSYPSPKKKFASSLTGDINVHSSHWNNGKMKIVYNSAYVHIETSNFTFAPQAIIVYGCLCANFQECLILKYRVNELSRVERSRKIRLDSATRRMRCMRCMLCRCKMTAGHSYLLHGPLLISK